MKRGFLVLALFSTDVFSQTIMVSEGASLHEKNCLSCHQTDIYQREGRKVKNLSSLATAVENCNTQLGTGWFPEDVSAVVDYLNKNYYKFKK
jgi:hypothetical protein